MPQSKAAQTASGGSAGALGDDGAGPAATEKGRDPLRFSRRVDREHPPIGRFVDTPTGPLHFVEQGNPDDPTLVMLHGASGNLLDFKSSILDALSARWRVIAVDRPGYGHSAARGPRPWGVKEQVVSIEHVLRACGARRYALFGHSYGVALSIAWCALRGDQVRGVLALSGGMYDWPGAQSWRYRLGRIGPLGAGMGRLAPFFATPDLLRREMAEVFAPQAPPEDYAERAGVWLALRPRTFALNLKAMAEMLNELEPVRPLLGQLSPPVEVVNGDADEICAPTPAGPYAARLPLARLTWLKGVGHMPHHVAPIPVLSACDRLRERLA
ncbi:MAG: alpha/beta hydrolase [Pseudomonadota bacterium]